MGNDRRNNCGCPTRLRDLSSCNIRVLQRPTMRYPCTCIQTAASSGTLGYRAFWRLRSREHADQGMDSHGCAERDHLFRNVPQHPIATSSATISIFSGSDSLTRGIQEVFTSVPLRCTTMSVERRQGDFTGCRWLMADGGSTGHARIAVRDRDCVQRRGGTAVSED